MASDENLRNIKIDDMGKLVTIPIKEVFEKLNSRRYGLTHEEYTERKKIFGPNIIEEKKESIIPKLFGFMWNPLSWGLEIGALLAIVLIPGQGQPPDWPIFVGTVLLLIINAIVCCIEENRAANAAAALLVGLAATVRIRRSGQWEEEEVSLLVPGDVMEIKLGDIIPADARLLDGEPVIIDQSSLTGESLPVTKYPGDVVFSGSTCKQGETEAVVIATGVHTFFAKTANLVDITDQVGHFQKVLTAVGNFCICFIAIGIVLGLLVMLPIQHRNYRKVIDNLLVVLIGGIPIAMPTVLSSTMAVGSHRLSQQGAVIKRMGVVEDLARMDILCCNQTGSLIGYDLKVYKNSIKAFVDGVNSDTVILLGARASRLEDQDAHDKCIVGLLANPNEARAGITEMHFMPFNPEDKCTTTITYVDSDGIWHRISKGAPEQIILLCNLIGDELKNAQTSVHQLNEKGFRSLGVARQTVPERSKESPGGPWEFVGLLPLYHSPSPECVESIIVALKLGVNVKMISSDQLAVAKDTCRRLGMGTDIYLSSSLLGERQGEIAGLPVDELIEQADGFALVSPDHKYEIVTKLQLMKHICGMTGDGVNDARALRKADIGFALVDATNAARCASDIILTQPGLTVIINAVLTSRAIFQRMKNYIIYAVSATVYFVLALMLIALIWKFDFSPLMVLIISILNNTTIMTISKDRVKPSPHPDSWKFREIFATGIVRGTYVAAMTLIFFEIAHDTDFFSETFGVRSISNNYHELTAALYLQVSIMSQALILATRSRKSSFTERPGLLLVAAFLVAQLVATLIAVYASIGFARTKGIGWGWAGVIWLYSAGCYFFLDIGKLAIHQSRGKVWNNLLRRNKNNFGKGDRESKWVMDKRTSLGLQPVEPAVTFHTESTFPKLELLKRPRDKLNLLAWKKCLHTQVMSL